MHNQIFIKFCTFFPSKKKKKKTRKFTNSFTKPLFLPISFDTFSSSPSFVDATFKMFQKFCFMHRASPRELVRVNNRTLGRSVGRRAGIHIYKFKNLKRFLLLFLVPFRSFIQSLELYLPTRHFERITNLCGPHYGKRRTENEFNNFCWTIFITTKVSLSLSLHYKAY